MNQIQRWYEDNFDLLQTEFSSKIVHCPNYTWCRIERFPLPEYLYNQNYTRMLITLPGLYGIEVKWKYNFYLSTSLHRTDGIPMKHYYQLSGYNDLRHLGYARLCFHLRSFSPRMNMREGDNLFDICQALYNFLAQKRGV